MDKNFYFVYATPMDANTEWSAHADWPAQVAERLAELYANPFGGKRSGRYRIARKLICSLAGRRRLYEDDVRALTRALLEKGYVLIDLDSYFVVMGTNTFVNYRRANEDSIG
jgi:hypothetical protein